MSGPETGRGADRPDEKVGDRLELLAIGRPEPVGVGNDGPARRAMQAGAPAISGDGRYIAFVSESGELVDDDENKAADVFLRDLVEGRTILVSRSIYGGSAAGSSEQPSISADGRFVAFTSSAPDLVEADSNGSLDVFVHDVVAGLNTLVSRGSNGELADHDSFSPSISADGRFVAFSSLASNLDPRDADDSPDVYMHDRQTGRTILVSTSSGGAHADGPSGQPSISGDGRVIAFTSLAANLSPDDTNDVADVYVHDVTSGVTDLVSRGVDGKAGNGPSGEPSVSAHGEVVAFTSAADDLADGDDNDAFDVVTRDRRTGALELVSRGVDGTAADGMSHSPSVSGDGTRVAFLSTAPDLTPTAGRPGAPQGDDHVHAFVRDLDGAGAAVVDRTRERTPGDGDVSGVALSQDGENVSFASTSSDLAGQPRGDGESHVYTAGISTVRVPRPNANRRDGNPTDETD